MYAQRLIQNALRSVVGFSVALELAGCGGSSSSGSQPIPVEAINGFSVPPEPNAAANSATLAGVDSNQNGLRDDVERQLAQTARTTADFSAALVYAKEYQALLTGSLPANRADALIAYSRVNCALIAASESVKRVDVREILTNTAMRSDAHSAFFDIAIGFSPEELAPCAA